jgi:hypothetical protein
VSTLALACTPASAGAYTVSVRAVDADGVPAQASTTLVVHPAGSGGPAVTTFVATPPVIVLGNTTTLAVTVATGSGLLSYAYSGLPPGCATIDAAMLTCAPTVSGSFLVEAIVTAANHSSTAVGTNMTIYPEGGGLAPLLTAFSAVPNPVAGGQTTILTVIGTGASLPLSYRYAGLPAGCNSANVSQLPCTPVVGGSYRVEAIVANPAGYSAGVFVRLEVQGGLGALAPTVSSFFPDPSSISLGGTTVLFVAATGSSSPFTYLYAGLPSGCLSANTPTLPCSPTETGTFRVQVNVTNAVGVSANATTILTIHAAAWNSNSTGAGVFESPYLLVGVGVLAGVGASALAAALVLARRRPPVGPPRR